MDGPITERNKGSGRGLLEASEETEDCRSRPLTAGAWCLASGKSTRWPAGRSYGLWDVGSHRELPSRLKLSYGICPRLLACACPAALGSSPLDWGLAGSLRELPSRLYGISPLLRLSSGPWDLPSRLGPGSLRELPYRLRRNFGISPFLLLRLER